MPTVHREQGYRFYFYSHEPNEPPHVHVEKGGAALKAWLDPVTLARDSGFRQHEINSILELVRQNRQTLLEAWHGYFQS